MERSNSEMIDENVKNIDTIEKIDILGMNLESLQEKFIEIGLKKFNASQVFDWLHNKLVFHRKLGVLLGVTFVRRRQ